MKSIFDTFNTPKLIKQTPRNASVTSVIDIGSAKISCLVAKRRSPANSDIFPGRTHRPEIIGSSFRRSAGIKNGYVTNMDELELVLRSTIEAAETMAKVEIQAAIINVSCGRLKSEVFNICVPVPGEIATTAQVSTLLNSGTQYAKRDGRAIVHSVPMRYILDGHRGVFDPIGLRARELSADMHVVTGEASPLQNLISAVENCHVDVEAMIATPYASALSVLVDDEADLGVCCIDIGAGTTTLSVFKDGQLVHVDAIMLGGNNITTDIANHLSTRLAEAENLKIRYGSAICGIEDDKSTVPVRLMGEEDVGPVQIPLSRLTYCIEHRLDEIFSTLAVRLRQIGFADQVAQKFVITGGTSQIPGITELASRIFGKPVRLGRPLGVLTKDGVIRSPAFSVGVGMLLYPQVAHREFALPLRHDQGRVMNGGYLSRIGHWLKESF